MSKQVYSCLTESDDRGSALEAFQRSMTHLFNSRVGFVLTKESNPDGSFSMTLESNGQPLEPTKAQEAVVPEEPPVRSRKGKATADLVAQPE
jgi:hypothetical protein